MTTKKKPSDEIKREQKKWAIPVQLTDHDCDGEFIPNRIIKFSTVNLWRKLPTVHKEIKYLLGKTVREMYEARFYGKPAFVDSVTGQLYVNGKCQSGDQWIC